ncbi:MAG: selenocysteine-specific translation elongation factor [Planctomycetota bacterium]|jgi:selenocysteine-specific elongation factor
MNAIQTNITLGTAGHIDHGKTALIKCLTGCDTDRLKAEKQRGMSIDLGFAPCRISDMEIGIVDVPGHENFIKTMVAGASSIDGVIFVIAADDGIMPQTREHLDILTLLGVKYGIVALAKVDCVEPEQIEGVSAEVKDFLKGTFLENAPILPVSSITGQGFDGFYEALKEFMNTIKPRSIDGIFRMPVERTFSLKGYGTVVTGIPVSGSVKIGDEVVILPQVTKGRIRAIQVYKRDSDVAVSGQCAALNVPHWDYKTIVRGNVVTLGEYFSPQQWFLCKLHILDSRGSGLKTGTNIKFHTGTSNVSAIIYLLEGNKIAAGQECLAQVRLNEPIVAAPCDRFILRTLSPVRTIGGGMIIEAIPERLRRNRPEVLKDVRDRVKAVLVPKDFVEYSIRTGEALAVTDAEFSHRTKLPQEKLKEILDILIHEDKVHNLTPNSYIHSDTLVKIQQRLLDIIGEFHSNKPESPGITARQLYKASQLSNDLVDAIINLLISQNKLVERKHRLALPEHKEIFNEEQQKLIENVESLFSSRPFSPPKVEEVIEYTGASPEKVQKILRILIEQEQLVQIEDNLIFHLEAVERARQILILHIRKEGSLESVKFKYLLNTTRKFAIPLLDYFDRIGLTRRVGYTRYLKTPNEPVSDGQSQA